ncbi:MAG: SGNH/GDSL hydrolase family protein [Verrucomicrobiota bacterium]
MFRSVGAVAVFAAIMLVRGHLAQAQAPSFTRIVVFGDSLSDDGNVAHRVRDTFGFSYPSSNLAFNYSDYRFTNSSQTDPGGTAYEGVWHEQLANSFLHIPPASNSLDGGADYAFGGATTQNGSQTRTVVNDPSPFTGGTYTITIDNMGKQVDDYLATHAAEPRALYIVWGGGNDLFDNQSAATVTAAATRVALLVERLANAGGRYFLVPNVPPLGAVPNSFGDPQRVAALNIASASYRDKLNTAMAQAKIDLARGGINIQLYVLDVWLDLLRLVSEPAKYGFINATEPAQGKSVNPDQYLFWDDIHPTTAGHHQIAMEAFRLLSGQIPPLGRATNISTRGLVGTGNNILIGGFIVEGTQPKQVIIRGLGPTLATAGVTGLLADPTLTVFNSNHAIIATNDNWKDTQQAAIQASGYAPPNDAEPAVILTLAPGSYTAALSGVNASTGIALLEVYDLAPSAASTFHNLSTRGFVGTSNNVLIGGLIVAAGEPPVVVVRALGPTLANYGITAPLADPTIRLFNGNGVAVSFNDDWGTDHPTAVKATLLAPPNAKESAIVMSLPAGNYTAIVQGKNGTTGVALVEAYRAD